MKKSPTDVSPNEPGSGRTNQYRLSALFTITALVAFVLGMERWLGAAGAGVTVYLIVGGLMLAQFLSIPYIFGLKVPNCSFPEWLTILLIVTMMTGLFLPAVNSSFVRASPDLRPCNAITFLECRGVRLAPDARATRSASRHWRPPLMA